MINDRTVLAVIPARSGSKRCPGKNFRDFRGKPLYMWSVMAAYECDLIDTVIVSKDFDRPPALCTDTATNEDVLRYHLKQYPHDIVVLLQPTSPMRSVSDIEKCIELAGEVACVSYREDGTKNGAVYVATAEWIAKHDFTYDHIHYEMPNERSLDIDYIEDFER